MNNSTQIYDDKKTQVIHMDREREQTNICEESRISLTGLWSNLGVYSFNSNHSHRKQSRHVSSVVDSLFLKRKNKNKQK